MNLLADENIYRGVVDWLRSKGHDVEWIAEVCPAAGDDAILEMAYKDGRIIVSADLDFGELTIRRQKKAPGLLLLRLGALSGPEMVQSIRGRWVEIENNLRGNLIILTPRLVRKRPLHF